MGRKKVDEKLVRSSVVQFRCTQAFKEEMVEITKAGSHRDLSEMIEEALLLYRKQVGRKGMAPPR